jgi:cell division protein FtsI/penicillin-binding protein 2
MNPPGNGRMRIIGSAFALLGLMIFGQMVRIQNSTQAKELKLTFDKTYNQEVRVIVPERGNIYDRWGSLLAGNIEVYEVGISPPEVVNADTVAQDLSSIFGLDYQTIKSIALSYTTDGNETYQVVTDFVSADKVHQLEQRINDYANAPAHKRGEVSPSLAGVHWVSHLQRSYPENTLASNVLGFFNYFDRRDGHGFYGLEEQYNSLLAGTKQSVVLPINPSEIPELPSVPPGSSLILTIDREIQAAMERIANKAVEDTGSESATIVVMDPKSGEVLAMAVTPNFNPNQYWTYKEVFPKNSPYNRAIGELYEPGSVFKVLTMAAALDAGAVTPDTEFVDTGAIEVGGIYIYNWDRGAWGPQTMTTCMQHSLNVCLAWVSTQLGPTKFYEYLQNFGIGKYTGIDLAGEQVYPISLPGDSNWYPINLGTNAFGQGVAATPIEMITAISAMANDGKMMAPHVVKAYIQDGKQYDIRPRVIRQVVKPETARILTDMLAVSLEQEASSALIEGYRVAGKTGTAEIPGPEGYSSSETNASFVGWGPVDDPKFIIYIWLEKPSTSPWGSVVAAPVFSEAAQELTVLLQLPPDAVREQFLQ